VVGRALGLLVGESDARDVVVRLFHFNPLPIIPRPAPLAHCDPGPGRSTHMVP
jgi:hypothetical protein